MAAVSDITRKAVWDMLADMEWQVRYYAAASDRNKRMSFGLRFGLLTLVVAEGAIFAVAQSQSWFLWASGVIGLVLIGMAVWDALADYARNAATLRIISIICEGLKRENEALWRAVESDAIDQKIIEATLKSINDRWLMAVSWDEPATNQKINVAATAAADAFLQRKYAQEPSQ